MYGMFGMPASEIELTKRFKDSQGLKIIINSSCKGFVICWADYSTSSKVSSKSAKDNMEEAIKILKDKMEVIEI